MSYRIENEDNLLHDLPLARKLRVQYPGAMYHLMNRGDRREAICADDEDREAFLSMLDQAVEARAKRLLNESVRRIGWSKEQLMARHRGDPHKVQIARELRAHTVACE